jgi:membrane-anchored mycosin MYCP
LALLGVGPAAAISPPPQPGGPAPLDGPPGPEFPTAQNRACLGAGLMPNSDLLAPPPASVALNLKQAWSLSRGDGVSVAIIDTGVHPNARLASLSPGGDYVVAGGDGLSDCDAHGTLVAGIVAAQSAAADGFEGVAPGAHLISIRWKSGAFNPQLPGIGDPTAQSTLDVRTLARAIVHAANLGARVIDVTLPDCVDTAHPVDQTVLAGAVGYAVDQRDAVLIAAAGDTSVAGCSQQNPDVDPATPNDARNWTGVKTISTPGWFSPDVLAVGFTTAQGAETSYSLAGPWVSVAAPGTGIESLDPGGSTVVNGVGAPGQLTPVGGSTFAAAYVGGLAALLRSRFPTESHSEILARIEASAHAPARGVDNAVGSGVIDPVQALSYPVAPSAPRGRYQARPLAMPPAAPAADRRPLVVAGLVIGAAVLLGLAALYANATIRRAR